MTPEKFLESEKNLARIFADQPELMRQWLEVLMSNTLRDLGYDQKFYLTLSLKYGWSMNAKRPEFTE